MKENVAEIFLLTEMHRGQINWTGLPLTIGMWLLFFLVILPAFGGWSWDLLIWGALGIIIYIIIKKRRGY